MKIFLLTFGLLFSYRFIQYITTPLLRKTGYYTYFSPLFFIMPINKKTYEIHLGTSWDFFRLNKKKPTVFLILLLEGLINLIDSVENKKISPNTVFKAKIHFFKKETLERFGFQVKKFNTFEYLLFIFQYIELFLLKLLVQKSFNPPDIRKVVKVSFSASELVEKKDLLLQTYKEINCFENRDLHPIRPGYPVKVSA
jgi:hypothetical protein